MCASADICSERRVVPISSESAKSMVTPACDRFPIETMHILSASSSEVPGGRFLWPTKWQQALRGLAARYWSEGVHSAQSGSWLCLSLLIGQSAAILTPRRVHAAATAALLHPQNCKFDSKSLIQFAKKLVKINLLVCRFRRSDACVKIRNRYQLVPRFATVQFYKHQKSLLN